MKKLTAAYAIAAGSLFLLFIKGMQKTTKVFTGGSGTRGYRNNNPLNIRYSSTAWAGKVANNTDAGRTFEQFTSMPYGFRAAMVLIRTYVQKYDCRNVSQIINRWAPPTENNTTGYISTVCSLTGFSPMTAIDPGNKDQMSKLVKAMAKVENGYYCNDIDTQIAAAWQLYIS